MGLDIMGSWLALGPTFKSGNCLNEQNISCVSIACIIKPKRALYPMYYAEACLYKDPILRNKEYRLHWRGITN